MQYFAAGTKCAPHQLTPLRHAQDRHPACGQIWRGIAEYDFGSEIEDNYL